LQDTVTFRNSAGLVTSFYDYDYDVRDRLTKRTDSIDGVARSINYGYDIASNRTSITTASGTTTYSYDDRNRLDLVKLNGALQADYDYDAASRLTQTTFGNGTRENRSYDTLNRLTTLETKRLGDNVQLSKYIYTLDKVGNRKSVTEAQNGQGRSIGYTYDDLYRLTGESIVDVTNGNRASTYVYDKVGNRQTKTINGVTTTYVYDGNDRLLNEKVSGVVTASYTYDDNGSTLTKAENGITTTYVWNDEKRLIQATVGTTQVDYRYNDAGIRVSSKQNGVETRYLLDEGMTANVWEEYAPNGTVQASYVYGNDLITQTQTGQTSYYLVDGLGSTRSLTDAQGQVLNTYSYEAFGEATSQSGTTSNKYQYAGEQFDAALGDYYLRQRSYDTSSGRFGRMDTYQGNLTNPSTLNKYIYTHGNPINGTDPTGLFDFSIAGLTATQSIGVILIGIGLVGMGVHATYDNGGYQSEPLGGYGEGAKSRTILDGIFAWVGSWKPEPLGGYGQGKNPSVPIHTGRSAGDIDDFAALVFSYDTGPLIANMTAAHRPVPSGYAAHHIVAGKLGWYEDARQVLASKGIDLQDNENGAILYNKPGYYNSHQGQGLHSKRAAERIIERLDPLTPDEARKELLRIGQEMESGTFTF
jgi:RHS repeat-associated protein